MRKILKTIESCYDCYYKRILEKGSFKLFRCCHPEYKGKNGFSFLKNNSILVDCPLKDVGVSVGVAVILLTKDNKVLIGKRVNTSSGEGLWGLPGGRMELWEEPKETAVRETQEETGIVLKGKDLKYTFFTNDIFKETEEHWITLYYVASDWDGDPKIMEPDKCSEWEWRNVEKLPKNIFCGWEEPLKELLKNKI